MAFVSPSRALVFATIGAVALALVWFWAQPDCAGGRMVASQAECQDYFSDQFCRTAFARAGAVASRSGAVYTSQAECLERWPACDRRAPFGYGPRPSHWCLAQGADGAPSRIEPQYNNRRQ